MLTRVPFLTAEWRYLTMLNYEVEPAALLSYVPPGLEIDSWNGKTYVSVVGMLFFNRKFLGVSIPFYPAFEQVNVRFYVRRKLQQGWRQGVVFVKEIVSRVAVATAARLLYRQPYVVRAMRHHIEFYKGRLCEGSLVEYLWSHQGRWSRLAARVRGESAPIVHGSEQAFIAERYWGYAVYRNTVKEFRVSRPPWKVRQVTDACLEGDVRDLCGTALEKFLVQEPNFSFFVEGSPVSLYRGTAL